MIDFRTDPALALLRDEPPDAVLALPPDEQAWRGRLFLVCYGAGFEIDMAWWFILRDADEEE